MSEIFKGGTSLFFKIIVVMIMSYFLTLSVSVLCFAGFTDEIGYTAFGTKEGQEKKVELYTYYYEDGKDLKAEKFEKEGYTVTKNIIRSPLSDTGKTIYSLTTQGINIIILCLFVYSQLWKTGNKDFAKVKIGKAAQDKLKGLKIGLIASVPQLFAYLWLLISGLGLKPDFKTAIYKLLNYQFYIINNTIIGNSKTAGALSALDFILVFLPLLIVPIAAEISYMIGYKDICISEKLIYKKSNNREG